METLQPPIQPKRLQSLDALRGFDMFWIIGGDAIVQAFAQIWPNAPLRTLAHQLHHKDWDGFAFYDLIFPLFVFIVGVSLVFSLRRLIEQNGKVGALRRILIRSLLLYGFGVLVYGGFSQGLDHIRWVGVLQRIAICYAVAGTLFCFFRLRTLITLCVTLLLGYWALTSFLPVRNFNLSTPQLEARGFDSKSKETQEAFHQTGDRVSGRFEDGLNLPQHFDYQYLPGRKWDGAYDPEGILSTLPAIATCLLGVFAGLWMRNQRVSDSRRVGMLVVAGMIGVAIGFLWGLQFPVIKKLWTSSYVLVAGGFSCLLLAGFYQVVDRWGWNKWCRPFLWIGTNSILLYLIVELLPVGKLAAWLIESPAKSLGQGAPFVVLSGIMALLLSLAWFLHRKRWFLRL